MTKTSMNVVRIMPLTCLDENLLLTAMNTSSSSCYSGAKQSGYQGSSQQQAYRLICHDYGYGCFSSVGSRARIQSTSEKM